MGWEGVWGPVWVRGEAWGGAWAEAWAGGWGCMGSGIMPQALSPEQEVEMLKSQAQTLGQQLDEIQRRLNELEKGS